MFSCLKNSKSFPSPNQNQLGKNREANGEFGLFQTYLCRDNIENVNESSTTLLFSSSAWTNDQKFRYSVTKATL